MGTNPRLERYIADFNKTNLRNHHECHHHLFLFDLLRTLLHGTAEAAASGQEASATCLANKTEPVVSGVITMPMLWRWDEHELSKTLKGNLHLHHVKTEDIRSHHRLLSTNYCEEILISA